MPEEPKECIVMMAKEIKQEQSRYSSRSRFASLSDDYSIGDSTPEVKNDATATKSLSPVVVYIDSCAPRGVTSRKDAIVRITNSNPRINLRGVGGIVTVEAIVTIGYYVYATGSDKLHYFEVEDCLYSPDARAELYPTRASFLQASRTHHFDPLCHIQFANGIKVPFESTEGGYKLNAFYGGTPKQR